jgi:hypothetical protein
VVRARLGFRPGGSTVRPAKMAPSSLPANRSTPRSHFVVPLPPVGSSRQTIRVPTPKGQAPIRNRSIRQRSVPEPDSTTGSRGNPGPPCLPDARRLRSDPIDLALRVRSHRRSTPSPVGVGVTGSGPVPVGSSVRMVRRFARRHSVVPPGLDTRVPVAEPLVPRGASVVAVLPEHSLPYTRAFLGRFFKRSSSPEGSKSACAPATFSRQALSKSTSLWFKFRRCWNINQLSAGGT